MLIFWAWATCGPIQDYAHPENYASPTHDMTSGFNPFTIKQSFSAFFSFIFLGSLEELKTNWSCLGNT